MLIICKPITNISERRKEEKGRKEGMNYQGVQSRIMLLHLLITVTRKKPMCSNQDPAESKKTKNKKQNLKQKKLIKHV